MRCTVVGRGLSDTVLLSDGGQRCWGLPRLQSTSSERTDIRNAGCGSLCKYTAGRRCGDGEHGAADTRTTDGQRRSPRPSIGRQATLPEPPKRGRHRGPAPVRGQCWVRIELVLSNSGRNWAGFPTIDDSAELLFMYVCTVSYHVCDEAYLPCQLAASGQMS